MPFRYRTLKSKKWPFELHSRPGIDDKISCGQFFQNTLVHTGRLFQIKRLIEQIKPLIVQIKRLILQIKRLILQIKRFLVKIYAY
jgi:hypothetical protein